MFAKLFVKRGMAVLSKSQLKAIKSKAAIVKEIEKETKKMQDGFMESIVY